MDWQGAYEWPGELEGTYSHLLLKEAQDSDNDKLHRYRRGFEQT
jgi:hypothetical protein